MKPIRILIATCALALPTGGLLAGCGGDDGGGSDEDPQTVLDETFDNETSVSSGNLTISASVSAEGEQGGSFEGSLSGPFQTDPENPAALPQLDWTATATGDAGGQSLDFSGGVVVTEDNAFLEYNESAYEVGTEQFTQLKDAVESQAGSVEVDETASFSDACAQALEQAGATDTAACDIDISSWLTNLTNEGTEDVGGSESVHLSGEANVDQILTDIGELAAVVPGAAEQGIDPSQLGSFSGAVTDATVDVYSTVDENLLSKFDISLTIDPSAIGGDAIVPIDTVDVGFGFEIADINEEQSFEAPADAQPISELFGDLGVDLGDLGALGGAVPGGIPGTEGGGGGGGAGAADDYLECLNQATTPDEINACANEL